MTTPGAFARDANAYLRYLSRVHSAAVLAADDAGVVGASRTASVVRRAHAVSGACARLAAARGGAPRGGDAHAAEEYLRGLCARMRAALAARDAAALVRLVGAGEETLEALACGGEGAFGEVGAAEDEAWEVRGGGGGGGGGEEGGAGVSGESVAVDDVDGVPTMEEREAAAAAAAAGGGGGGVFGARRRSGSGPRAFWPFGGDGGGGVGAAGSRAKPSLWVRVRRLGLLQRLTLALYVVMVLGALVAVIVITRDFVRGVLRPEAALQISVKDALPAPVVTVCSSMAVPQSRVQMYGYTDATGAFFNGSFPNRDYADVATPAFRAVVDRFFDNPDGEDCAAVLGDYYPLPFATLQEIADGARTSRCRPCFRVGAKGPPVAVTDTAFSRASYLEVYTDSCFLQCLYAQGGLEPQISLPFVVNTIFDRRVDIEAFGFLSVDNGSSVEALPRAAFDAFTSPQACSLMYFAFFPSATGNPDPSVDIRYQFVSADNAWVGVGDGPYFRPPTRDTSPNFTEALEMFVSDNATTAPGAVKSSGDVALLGPNSQAYATLKPIVVTGQDRYDISVSSSTFVVDTLEPVFGYWRKYAVYYGFPRLIQEEIYERVAYPTSQWLVDFLGYFGMFTGLSIFSLFLVPVVHWARRSEKRRVRAERPEALIWGKYKRLAEWKSPGLTEMDALDDEDPLVSQSSMRGLILP